MKTSFKYLAKSERLQLRELTDDDFSFFFDVFNNARAMEYYSEHRNAEKTKDWINFNFEHYRKHRYGKWAIENHSYQLMGHSGLIHTSIDGIDEIELGYFLHPSFWHQGFATEAALLCKNLAFEKFNLNRIVSAMNPANIPSKKVAERVGMTWEKAGIATVGTTSWHCDVYAVCKV